MDYYLSLETCKQLKEWKCDIGISNENDWILHEMECVNTYDIRDIVCNGEIAKAFFGEYTNYRIYTEKEFGKNAYDTCSIEILLLLQQNKKKDAEKYILKNTVFNPKNK